jgi:GNAT superfamily N-acetyltransferase
MCGIMPYVGANAVQIRPATASDRPEAMQVARRALGWRSDERDRAFFAWKHDENPFGQSPAWVATDDEKIVGFRTFLRWELVRGADRRSVVRAVDTATDPDHQGKGIFRQLTLAAVSELTAAGFDSVFNTPNSQSRPGYLKMGWTEIGRPTLAVLPRGPGAVLRMGRSRQPAEKWSEPTPVGQPTGDALTGSVLETVLATLPPWPGWSTPRTAEYLRWRYGFEPLQYRVLEVQRGMAIFRVRRRGPSREIALCEWLAPGPDRRALRKLVDAAGDYLVACGMGLPHGLVPVPRLGPVLTWRPLARPGVVAVGDLDFRLGDLELF